MTVAPEKAVAGLRIAQITQLIRDNQLLTAALVFILWQAGSIATAMSLVGGVC